MGLPVFEKCCCLELKWGALIVGIVDILLCLASSAVVFDDFITLIIWLVCMVIYIAHIIACILVIVSVWVQKKKLVILYIFTDLLRVIIIIVYLIIICVRYPIKDVLFVFLYYATPIGLGIYFWFVIYSWFEQLRGSTPAD